MNFFSKLFSDFKERSILLVIVLIISTIIAFISYYFLGRDFALTIIIPLLTLIFTVSKNVWSSDSGQTKVALVSIGVILLLVIGATLSPTITDILLEPLYNRIPQLKGIIPAVPISFPVMIIASIVIVAINFFMRDSSAMNKHSTPLEKEFPEPEYKERLKRFCRVFKDDLDRIERDSNWSSEFFVPLDSEVTINHTTTISKKKKDLISALKNEKTAKSFLVVGQPGAGKSVALRKLCRELLEEVEKTGKVPIYINLKEWSSVSWSKKNPPNRDDFHKFVLQNLKNQGDRFTDEFLKVYFDRMVEKGRIFFIFDSFDEIPALLEDGDTDWILERVSKIIHKYINGAHDSRGIVATRPYKKPTNQLSTDATIEILPLSEQRVADAMGKYPAVPQVAINELLSTRRELLPIAKNPFYCALIVNYVQDNNNNKLPDNRSDLFRNYVEKRLDECSQKIAEKGLSKTDVEDACQQIANLMFNSETYGFEYPINELQESANTFDDKDFRKIIEILVYSKIGRHSNSEKTLFTFAHKRFAEYFAVLSILGNENNDLLEDIHNDGKWRDVLVLLAELEDENKSYSIAHFTWEKLVRTHNEIAKTGKTYSLVTIHGLRFLRDAYLSRKNVVNRLQHLGKYIWQQLTSADTILEKKIAMECVGLLDEEAINVTILEAFRQNISWLSETALKSCFYLDSLEPKLQKSLIIYIDSSSIFSFLKRFRSNLFILNLSNNFSTISWFTYIKLIDCLLILLVYISHTVQNPVVAVIFLIAVFSRFYSITNKSEKFSVAGVMGLRFDAILIPLIALGMTNILNFLITPSGYQIAKWDTPAWLIMLNTVILIPWYQIYYYFIKFRKFNEITYGIISSESSRIVESSIDKIVNEQSKAVSGINIDEVFKSIKSLFKFIILFIIIIFVFAALTIVLPIYLLPYSYLIYGLFLFIWIYSSNLKNFYYQILDRKLNNKFFRQTQFSRLQISEHFYKLTTKEERLNFVNKLGVKKLTPSGEWENKLPNIYNDDASIRLAQLEESWQNLDR